MGVQMLQEGVYIVVVIAWQDFIVLLEVKPPPSFFVALRGLISFYRIDQRPKLREVQGHDMQREVVRHYVHHTHVHIIRSRDVLLRKGNSYTIPVWGSL